MTQGPRAEQDRPGRPRRRGAALVSGLALVATVLAGSQWLSGYAASDTAPPTRPGSTATSTPVPPDAAAAPAPDGEQAPGRDGGLLPEDWQSSLLGGARAGADDVAGLGGDPAVELVTDLRESLRRADTGQTLPDQLDPLPVDLRLDARPLDPACTAEPGEDRHEVCVVGDRDGARTTVVVGSSHIMMWLPGLRAEAERAGVRLVVFVKYGCAPYTFTMRRQGVPWTECDRWLDWVVGEVNTLSPDLVLAGSHTWVDIAAPDGSSLTGRAFDDAWAGGVAGLVQRLAPVREAGGRVVVLGDTTRRDRDPWRCAESRRATYAGCEQRVRVGTVHLNDVARVAVQDAGGAFYDTGELTCVDARCPVVADGRFLFRDSLGHVSATYARHVGGALARRVGMTR